MIFYFHTHGTDGSLFTYISPSYFDNRWSINEIKRQFEKNQHFSIFYLYGEGKDKPSITVDYPPNRQIPVSGKNTEKITKIIEHICIFDSPFMVKKAHNTQHINTGCRRKGSFAWKINLKFTL